MSEPAAQLYGLLPLLRHQPGGGTAIFLGQVACREPLEELLLRRAEDPQGVEPGIHLDLDDGDYGMLPSLCVIVQNLG